MSLGVARKNTNPGLDGAGGRYVPTSTSRAPAGSGVFKNSVLSAAPSTSSLLWLAIARGAGRVAAATTALSVDDDKARGAEERVQQEVSSRREGKGGEKTEEEAIRARTGSCLVRAGGEWINGRELLSR